MNFEKNVKIYVLRDPETREIRYVGKTVGSLEKRLSEHLKYNGTDHRSFWIQSLLKQNLEPTIEQVDVCYDCEWQEKETMWIQQCKAYGYDLTNGTEGGDGCTGWKHTEESRKNLSKALKGRVFTEEWKQKIRESLAKTNIDPEVRKRRSLSKKGKPSPRRGCTSSDECKANMSKALKGRIFTEEHKRRLSEAGKRRYAKLKTNVSNENSCIE